MRLCFATQNEHKLQEVRAILPSFITLVGLAEIGCFEEIPETADTLEGNAQLKAQYVWEHHQMDCFADDTGLEVAALNGEPGVMSARYAGPQKNAQDNCAKLLQELGNTENREAQFRTVICLFLKGEKHLFEGIVKGRILKELRGHQGFGYDPLFQPHGHEMTFAEMTPQEKNNCSHRAEAIAKLKGFFKNQ
ncbi:MAG: non-canonical purine NTP diphosphatase [Cyclobacteriaceae bacterium]|nr:non-canonical purine NTP diphosphatase [Cyclobacteriaceae bacterium]